VSRIIAGTSSIAMVLLSPKRFLRRQRSLKQVIFILTAFVLIFIIQCHEDSNYQVERSAGGEKDRKTMKVLAKVCHNRMRSLFICKDIKLHILILYGSRVRTSCSSYPMFSDVFTDSSVFFPGN
jgi:hypothetical protein